MAFARMAPSCRPTQCLSNGLPFHDSPKLFDLAGQRDEQRALIAVSRAFTCCATLSLSAFNSAIMSVCSSPGQDCSRKNQLRASVWRGPLSSPKSWAFLNFFGDLLPQELDLFLGEAGRENHIGKLWNRRIMPIGQQEGFWHVLDSIRQAVSAH